MGALGIRGGNGRVFEIGRWGSGECHKSSEVVVVHGCEVGMTARWERPSDGVGMGQRAVALEFLGARVALSVGGLAAWAAQRACVVGGGEGQYWGQCLPQESLG